MTQEDEEFEIEDIVGVKRNKGGFYFRVRWFGYKPFDDTWEPEHNLVHLTKFRKKMTAFKEELVNHIEIGKKKGKRVVPKIDRGNVSTINIDNENRNNKIKREDLLEDVHKKKKSSGVRKSSKLESSGNTKHNEKKRTRQNEDHANNYNARGILDGVVMSSNKTNSKKIREHKGREYMNNVSNFTDKEREGESGEEIKEIFLNGRINTSTVKDRKKEIMTLGKNDTIGIRKTYFGDKRRKLDEKQVLNIFTSGSSEVDTFPTNLSICDYLAIQSSMDISQKNVMLVEDIYGVRVRNDEIQYMACLSNDKAIWLTENEIEKTPHIKVKLKDYKRYILQDTKEELAITIKNMHTIGNYLYLSVILNLGNGEGVTSLYPSKVVEYIYPHEYLKFLLSKLHLDS